MTGKRSDLPLVAVVTPVFNGAPWLERTLACVQRQTYRNIVHVILDNASTDESPRLIDRARAGPVPIIARRNPQTLRQTENWNAAMALAPPEAAYVKWLCADDLMAPDCIEKMVRLAESDSEIDLVMAVDIVDHLAKGDRLDAPRGVYDGPEIARMLLTDRLRHLPAAHMFFRATPERLRAPFDASTVPAMDADFVVRDLLNRKVGYIFEPLLFSRVTPATETAKRGGFRASILPGLSRLTRYGPRLLSESEFKAAKRRERRKLTRHALAWKAARDENADRALEMLRAEGFMPGPIDYAVAVASWPAHKVRRELARFGAGPPWSTRAMTERDFLDEAQTPDGPEGPPPPPRSKAAATA
jgi:glycosyltransferase involved in cell wall biosynthesis